MLVKFYKLTLRGEGNKIVFLKSKKEYEQLIHENTHRAFFRYKSVFIFPPPNPREKKMSHSGKFEILCLQWSKSATFPVGLFKIVNKMHLIRWRVARYFLHPNFNQNLKAGFLNKILLL